MKPYQSLPNPPNEITEGAIIARLVDGIGFRYRIATEGLTTTVINFRPTAESRNMLELLQHIYDLICWTGTAFELPYTKRTAFADASELSIETLELCHYFSSFLTKLSKSDLEKVRIYLKRTDTNYSFWYLINGPLADVLTHIGQVASWRRIAGNPIARISPFTGDAF